MKNKFKKIMVTTLISMTATTAIGCATTNTKIAQKINNGVENFVSSINNLDYVETNNTNSNLGKIVSAANENNLYTKVASNSNIENTITRPSERTDNFKLYVLSKSPYISLTSDDNNINLSMQFSTEKIETTSNNINEDINKLILKRAILMIYVNEIYSGNVNLTDENRKAINAYVNIIKENASYLDGNRGMVKNQLGMASDLINNNNQENIVNYYIIKSGEALEIRSNKINSTISAIDSIISILERNLTPSSCYYQNNLTNSYQDMISKMNTNTLNSEDEILAKNIAESINLISPENNTNINNSKAIVNPKITTRTQNTNYQNDKNCVDCNDNSNIKTLENIEENKTTNTNNQYEKTQNNSNISRNINNTTENQQKTITPANTNRTRRVRNNITRRNYINNQNLQNNTNPTQENEIVTPSSNQNLNRTTNENRATRVPYRT